MKTAIYIEDGVVQLVITPDSEFEKNAVKQFADAPMETKIFSGSFYDCRGGWTRQNEHYNSGMYGSEDNNDKSLIIRTQKISPSKEELQEQFDKIEEDHRKRLQKIEQDTLDKIDAINQRTKL